MSSHRLEVVPESLAKGLNEDRSLAKVLQNILRNTQEIVRLEVSLAKSQIREEIGNLKSAVLLAAVGAVLLFLSSLYLLEGAYLGLSLVVPAWSAALLVGAGTAAFGGLAIILSRARFRACYPAREATIDAKKDGVHWTEVSNKLKNA
jgi:Putative Actinobacterial Holin-X, holin superfamily III